MDTSLTNPFFANRLQTVELARRRYFEEGVTPAGAISDAVFQSWARCQRLHDRPERSVEFQPVTQSRTHLALQKNRSLHEAWTAELPNLQRLLGTTSCAAMLTDGTGVLIGATCAGRPHESLMPVATRVGVDLSEEAVGTTAPGVVVRTGQPICVIGSEHFFDGVRQMHCAAAPIRDIRGSLAGVLDISSESIAFGFDAATVVGHLACAIENRLLIAQAREHLVVRLQVDPSLLDSALAGLVGVSLDGRVAWLNGTASRLLGIPAIHQIGERPSAEEVLGHTLGRLASVSRHRAAALMLPNGLTLWARSDLRATDGWHEFVQASAGEVAEGPAAFERDGGAAPDEMSTVDLSLIIESNVEAESEDQVLSHWRMPPEADGSAAHALGALTAEPSATVKTVHLDLLEKTLRECGGNLSKASRRLGVSRGWIYRRMKAGGVTASV